MDGTPSIALEIQWSTSRRNNNRFASSATHLLGKATIKRLVDPAIVARVRGYAKQNAGGNGRNIALRV